MKNLITALCCMTFTLLAAGEREELLKEFRQETAAADQVFQSAMTTIELTAGAGEVWSTAEKQLYRALDHKLRHTADRKKRLQILKNFHALSKRIQQISDTPRRQLGSLAGMRIYHTIAVHIQQQTEILMLEEKAEKIWNQIADSTLLLNTKAIELTQGKAEFNAVMYDEKTTLEILLFPKHTFSYDSRLFAIIRTDKAFSGNDDFSTIYLCEAKQGKLHIHTKCKMPFFTKFELKNNQFILYGSDGRKEIVTI